MSRLEGGESLENSPFTRLRIARIDKVLYDIGADGAPADGFQDYNRLFGRVAVKWLDFASNRGREEVRLMFPFFSNAAEPKRKVSNEAQTGGKVYGDISMPSVGDVVILGFLGQEDAVVLGYLPANYYQQTRGSVVSGKDTKDSDVKPEFGHIRRIVPGEMLRQSKQQAEFFMDKAGAVHITVKDQSTDADGAVGGATTTKASAIDPAFVPTTEIAKVTIGETYTDDTLASRDVTAEGEKVVLRVKMASGTSLKIDSAGNVELSAAGKVKVTGSEVNLNSGEKGVAREDDEVKSVSADDRLFWLFLTSIVTSYNSHTHPGQGIPTPLLGIAPSSLTGKITEASDSVKAGD